MKIGSNIGVSKSFKEKPRNVSLDEFVNLLDGLNISPEKVLPPKANNLEKGMINNLLITPPYQDSGFVRIKISGEYHMGRLNNKTPFSYEHTFGEDETYSSN